MVKSNDFSREAIDYILAGQSVFFTNTRDQSKVISTIRKVGWQLADVRFNRVMPVMNSAEVDSVLGAAKLADIPEEECHELVASGQYDPKLCIAIYEAVSAVIPTDDKASMLENAIEFMSLLLDTHGYLTVCYDSVTGFELPVKSEKCDGDLVSALTATGSQDSELPKDCLIVFKDCHLHMNTSETNTYRTALRNQCENDKLVASGLGRHLFFVQPHFQPHYDIRHCFAQLNFPPPSVTEIDDEITRIQQSIKKADKRECPIELRSEIVTALRGLDSGNIVRTLSKCLVEFSGFVPELTEKGPEGKPIKKRLVPTIRAMRSRQLSSSQGLRIIDPDDPELLQLGSLGGYENLLELIDDIKLCRTPKAKEARLVGPSGFGLAGPPGTGKTHCAKLTAHWLGVPLLIVNLGSSKSAEGLYGVSEANMSQNIETIRSIGECVVLFDEWDKQSQGIVGNSQDGTASNMLSQILEFASDPRRQAILVFTMNRLHGPIESLRAGRISDFFYTPLPDAQDREEILKIKLEENGAAIPRKIQTVAADTLTAGLSGAELTEMVLKACRASFRRCSIKEPTVEELVTARASVTPVTKLRPEEMKAMTEFEAVATSVSKKKDKARTVQQIVSSGRSIRLNPSDN